MWDHICGTVWKKGDQEERYEKSRVYAEKLVREDERKEVENAKAVGLA